MEIALLKFIYSEKATKFCEISTVVDLTSKNFVAFAEYMNFKLAFFNKYSNENILWNFE